MDYEELLKSRQTASQVLAAENDGASPFDVEIEDMLDSPLMAGFRPSRSEDPIIQRLHAAQHVMRQSGNLTLKPLLPLLLSIRGKPYNLNDHFPFAPFFRTRMPTKTLLKTGRQVSKSTSLAAQGVLFSNCIPYFSTLYLTPLFEMIRRFSQNYVAPFIETSPVARLFSGTSTTNNVLQRSFKNRSQMIFSFAYLDAERTRGISADKNCLAAGSMVELVDGRVLPIEQVEPGTCVVSADKNGTIVEDTVTERLYQGVQDVFEVVFSDGSVVRCTADERFSDSAGQWVYLQDLFARSPEADRSPVELIPEADALRLFVRRRRNIPVQPDIHLPTLLSARAIAGSLLPRQGRTAGRLRNQTARRSGQSRLGRGQCLLRDGVQPGVRRTGPADNGRRQEDSHHQLGRSPGLGVDCLLGNGRWHASEERHSPVHARVLARRSRVVGVSAAGIGTDVCGGRADQGAGCGEISHPDKLRRLAMAFTSDRGLGSSQLAVQIGAGTSASDVLGLRSQFSRPQGSSRSARSGLQGPRMRADSTSEVVAAEHDGRAATTQKPAGQTTVQTCGLARILRVTYLGAQDVWDLNTASQHAFFADGVLVHNCIDEIQDMDIAFLPIIHETISASRDWGIIQYAGTPKTLDNTIERLWTDSSMAEWVIRCHHPGCGHWNIPSLEFDLLKMIGPVHEGISNACPGVICARCAKPINPRPPSQGGTGRWVHRHVDRRWSFAGYHVPQIIMPMHYASVEKWQKLVDKMNGKGNTPVHVFYNEVCGESWDSGTKLVSVTDLKRAACLPWPNRLEPAQENVDRYIYRFVAVDWGGGGVNKGRSDLALQSYTSIAVCGLLPDGRVDVIYGFRSMTPHEHVREAKLILGIMSAFRCSHVVHDYTGAGTVRETLLSQSGLSLHNILPVAYIGPAKGSLITFKPATRLHPRNHYTMDRNRALSYCCQFIKSGIVRFFQYDYKGSEDPGLLHDFLNLIEDKRETGFTKDKYKILRDPAGPDDFAQAVTIGTMMLFQMHGAWPDMAAYEDVEIDEDAAQAARGINPADWL